MGARVQYLIVFGAFLLAWAALCFWAGLGFALVASLLLLAGLVPVSLYAGHRFVNRWYVAAELGALVVAVVVSIITGFVVAGILFAVVLGVDVLVCSALLLTRGRGAFRNVTRNLLIILATLGVATGASAVTAAVAPIPSCGSATVGLGGADVYKRQIALEHVAGPAPAMEEIDALRSELDGYHLYWATRAELLRRFGRHDEAADADRRAMELTDNPSERALLEARLDPTVIRAIGANNH